jgi:hypothetical protein
VGLRALRFARADRCRPVARIRVSGAALRTAVYVTQPDGTEKRKFVYGKTREGWVDNDYVFVTRAGRSRAGTSTVRSPG